jgi:AraC-like DNA-binding protein
LQNVRALAAQSGCSVRRLGNLFSEHIGMGPKRYIRLQRFRSVLTAHGDRRSINWSAVAADFGFHDQSHLVHEFREFSGLTPGEWLASTGEYPDHVPIGPLPSCF